MKFLMTIFLFLFLSTCLPLTQSDIKLYKDEVVNSDVDKQSYELLFWVLCNGKWERAQGLYYCQQNTGMESRIKFVFPPVPGNFRASSCRENIVSPESFNITEEFKGWWIFKKRVYKHYLAEVPLGVLTKDANNCPISISVLGEGIGMQRGIVIYRVYDAEKPAYSMKLHYRCGNKSEITSGVGSCYQYSNSHLKGYIEFPTVENRTINIISKGCEIKEEYKKYGQQKLEFDFLLPQRFCVIDFNAIAKDPKNDLWGSLAYIGKDPTWRGIGKPLIYFDDDEDKIRVYKPAYAKYLYTMGIRTDKTQVYINKNDVKKYLEDGVLKAFAWSDNALFYGAFSYSFYNPASNQDVESLPTFKENILSEE